MGLFDRFTSRKGKDQTTGPKRGVVKVAKGKKAQQEAFAAVPSAKDEKVISKKEATVKPEEKRAVSTATLSATRVLIRPVVTEKSTRGGTQSQYTFEVAVKATKADVRQSIYHLYGVAPLAVNIITQPGKAVRFGRTIGRTMKRKKAIITLPTGKTIDIVNA